MLGMKENLIDMLGTVFANRQNEANVRAAITVEYKEESKKYEAALHELFKQDKVNASIVESAGSNLANMQIAEAYYLGLRDGFTILQLLMQNEKPFSTIEKEAAYKVEASIPQDKPFVLIPYALRSTLRKGDAS